MPSFISYPSSGVNAGLVKDLTPAAAAGTAPDAIQTSLKNLADAVLFNGTTVAGGTPHHPGYPSGSLLFPYGVDVMATGAGQALQANGVFPVGFPIFHRVQIARIRYKITAGIASSTVRTFITKATTSGSSSLVVDLSSVSSASSGVISISPTSLWVDPGWYWVNLNPSAAVSVLSLSGFFNTGRNDIPQCTSSYFDNGSFVSARSLQGTLSTGSAVPSTFSYSAGSLGNFGYPNVELQVA